MSRLRLLLISLLIALGVFSVFAQEIEVFNSKVRSFIAHGEFAKFKFSDDGIPSQVTARAGNYTSPFYVVHFGLLYSEECRKPEFHDRFHWREDPTAKFWPGKPDTVSLENFRNTLDWLLDEVKYDATRNAHFIYDFAWPYRGYPDGKLKAGWWSGLTDGYAIVLLLRGYDCFGEEKYLNLASDLYKSVLTPVEEGGSLIEWKRHPWIEEYVDPTVPMSGYSRVWNGMAYAYFGVKSYEELTGSVRKAPALFNSMKHHLNTYDLGYWSYYDAIGSRANIKYHRVNWSLIADPRLEGVADEKIVSAWRVGTLLPIIYLFQGPASYGLLHAWFTLGALTLFAYIFVRRYFAK